jgi:tetratricopeptide (TPR) repeat protein
MRHLGSPLLIGALLLGLAAALNLDLASSLLARPYDVLHVPSGPAARVAALGHRTALSDLYWLSTVQYIGEPRAEQRGWDKLFPLADLVTDLDPRHGYAYQTAGIVLSAAGRLDESNAILEKGLRRGPPFWTFPYYLAFNHWFYLGDYASGARYAELAARTPGASPNISHLAVSLASKSGTPEQAVELIQELRRAVEDEVSAGRLDEQLKLAILERDAQALERAAAAYAARNGRPLERLEDLVTAGLVTALPPDQFGGRYLWDRERRQVRSSANPFRFSLREAPRRPQFQYQGPRRPLASEGAAAPPPGPAAPAWTAPTFAAPESSP